MRRIEGGQEGGRRGRKETGGGGGGGEGGPIILLFNPLKVEAHQSETTCSNDSCSAFIKV